jgi:hypothetical protein
VKKPQAALPPIERVENYGDWRITTWDDGVQKWRVKEEYLVDGKWVERPVNKSVAGFYTPEKTLFEHNREQVEMQRFAGFERLRDKCKTSLQELADYCHEHLGPPGQQRGEWYPQDEDKKKIYAVLRAAFHAGMEYGQLLISRRAIVGARATHHAQKGAEKVKKVSTERQEAALECFKKHHVGKVSKTAAVRRASREMGIPLSTFWAYMKSEKNQAK